MHHGRRLISVLMILLLLAGCTDDEDTSGNNGGSSDAQTDSQVDTGAVDAGDDTSEPNDTSDDDATGDTTSDTAADATADATSDTDDTGQIDVGPTVDIDVTVVGNGTILDESRTIECSSRCTIAVPEGQSFEVVAVGDTGSTFSRWTSCDDINGPSCQITGDADATVTAVFHEIDDFRPTDLAGCGQADSDWAVLEEMRLDDLLPGQTPTRRVGATSGSSTKEFINQYGTAESIGHFNIFDTIPFAATHVCVSIGEVSQNMLPSGYGGYTLYLASNESTDFGGPTSTEHSQFVASPSDTGMQLIELDSAFGPRQAPTWVGAVFPDSTNTFEMHTAPAKDPGVEGNAKLAVFDENNESPPHFKRFDWSDYESISQNGFATFRPLIRVIRAVPKTSSFALDVSKSGSGSGVIRSIPAGIDCGAACSADYLPYADVVLEAEADSGSSFAGWTGCDQQIGSFCVLSVASDRSVEAQFTP